MKGDRHPAVPFPFHSSSVNRSELDRPLLFSTVALLVIGLLALYVAVRSETPAGIRNPDFIRQSVWIGIGMAVMLLLAKTPFSAISGKAYVIFALGIFLLVITVLVAPKIRGAKSWIVLGSVRVQPSELFKPFCALALAALLSDRRLKKIPQLEIPLAAAAVLLPMALILLQPDLGTAVSYGALLVGVPYIAGLPVKYILCAFAAALSFVGRIVMGVAQDELNHLPTAIGAPLSDWRAGLVLFGIAGAAVIGVKIGSRIKKSHFSLVWILGWLISMIAYFASFPIEASLKQYQRLRIVAFVSPGSDPRGASYNVLQSMIAVGSGGLFGRGMTGASQTALGFLPERHTDFIFSAISETFGFLGAGLTLALYVYLLYRILQIGIHASSETGALCAAGIGSIFLFHLIVNVGMTLGLVPIIGIPLPLLSYGGSSMVSTLAALGLVQSIAIERKRAIYGAPEEKNHRNY